MALLLIALLPMTAMAAQPELTVGQAEALAGETVYLSVTLNEAVVGDSMGISFTYDPQVLKLMPAISLWKPAGRIQDMGSLGDRGVWTSETAKTLQGVVCVLAFAIREDAPAQTAPVECTLTVKNGEDTVAVHTAQGSVKVLCAHVYGQWKNLGTLGHSRKCTLCGQGQTESHNWSIPVVEKDPKDPAMVITTKTCAQCGAKEETRELYMGQELTPETTEPNLPPQPEGPQSWAPTAPESQESAGSTYPQWVPPYEDYNQSTVPTQPHSHEEHSHGTQWIPGAEIPGSVQDPAQEGQTGETAGEDAHQGHTHDHSHEPAAGSNPWAVIIALAAVLALLVGGCFWIIRRKR